MALYNAYLPHPGPYEKRPEAEPPGGGNGFFRQWGGEGLRSLWEKLPLSGLDSGDLLLLLVLILLWKEGEADPILLLTLAAAFLLDG